MSDHNPSSETLTPNGATPDEQPPGPGWHPALWVLIVLAAFLALAALWFALFGSPQVIGTDPGVGGSSANGSNSSVPHITLHDVRDVLAHLDYAESIDSSQTEYTDTVTQVVEGVDIPAFVRNTLDAAPTIWWIEPGTVVASTLSGAQKDAVVAEAIASWNKQAASASATSTLDAMFGVHFNTPTLGVRTRQDSLLEVVSQGLAPLGLMFGAHDADDVWSWRVSDVAITGLDSADVTFAASTTGGAGWSFTDPSVSYVKHLTFTRRADGTWLLASWPNYGDVLARFKANVTPPGAHTPLDEWWGSL